jgi:transcriptional regulator with XRE-family HTH domain
MTLRELREHLGLTQVDVSAAAEMTQSELSKAERREDHTVSMLRRIVEALGGELEMTACFGEKRFRLKGV